MTSANAMTKTGRQPLTDRRGFIGLLSAVAAAAIITPERALAGAAPAGWALGVADVEADIPLAGLERIHGRAPQDFSGTLYRNGPAKFRRGGGTSGHWFDGDGLMRRFHIADGQATLNARFADTPKRRLESQLDAIVQPGFGTAAGSGAIVEGPDDCNAANTGAMMAGSDLLALWEGGSALRMDPETLETRGLLTLRPDLRSMPFSAHPRFEPDGSSWNFGGNGRKTLLWRLNVDGSLASATLVDLPRASYFHDFTMTAQHIIIVLQPWLLQGVTFPLATAMSWQPEQGTQILILNKDDPTRRRLVELPGFAFFHLGDGWEEADGTIRFDGCFESDPTFGQQSATALLRGEHIKAPAPVLTQVVIRPDGRADMLASGIKAEFPQNDKRLAGRPRRRTVHVTGYRDSPFPHAIASWDWQRGRDDRHDFGSHQLVEEFLFVPRGRAETGSRETNGWLVGTTLNLAERATELHVLDAERPGDGPLVSWRAAMPLPLGFHGCWKG